MRRKLLLVATICALTVGVTSPPAGAYQSLGTADTPAAETVHTDSLAPAGSIDATERDILAGLLFGIGDFAAEIGIEVTQFRGITEAEYHSQVEEALDNFIEAHGPELKPVLADLRSGDIHRVETALTNLAQLFTGHLEAVYGPEQYALALQGTDPTPASPCGLAVVCFFYAAAAFHNTVIFTAAAIAALSAAAAIAVTVWCGAPSSKCQIESDPSRTEIEYLRAEIARAARA